LSMLAFSAVNAGKQAVAVSPAYTSQSRSGCGIVVQKGLSVRWHSCPDCAASLHRDHSAATNILWRGQRLRGTRGAARGREPRTRRATAPAECQTALHLLQP
jgi:putative transposase